MTQPCETSGMAEEWRVEVELREEGHGLTLGERLRSLDLDDEARERLGGNVIVTRDGSRMFVYAASEEAAGEAGRVIEELAEAEGLDADVSVTHWDAGDHEWEDIAASAHEQAADDDEHETRTGVPFLVFLESHKPKFLRDLGL
jgi:nucleotide-binding universal stress UspA family protein